MRRCVSMWLRASGLVLTLIIVTACGQTGELYYPEPPEEEEKKAK